MGNHRSLPVPTGEMAAAFVQLNRRLTWANSPEEWTPAAKEMHSVLDQLDNLVTTGELLKWDEALFGLVFAFLMTILAEAGQYRHEQFLPNPSSPASLQRRAMIEKEMMPLMSQLRRHAALVGQAFLTQPVFAPLAEDIRKEVFPLLDELDQEHAPDRYMPFRVIHVANVVERLYGFRTRTTNQNLRRLLTILYGYKYLRFGTSGVRGLWQRDFTEKRARQVVQAVCEFLRSHEVPGYVGAENLSGKKIVIGYDSRLNALKVAEWTAQVVLANGFTVELSNRDTPTPALVYYLADYLPPDQAAGLINLTASHNPPDWQGIKFNPRQGWPAPTNVTDFIAARINEINLLDLPVPQVDLEAAARDGRLVGFDPIDHYVQWVFQAGQGNARIPIDVERMRRYFADKKVVIDEMHGAGRGYLARLLGEIGIRHTIIHAERDPLIPGLDYANPEEPYINQLKDKVRQSGADLGMGTDTDCDRYGVVDRGGIYLRPNQILPMLTRYLGIERGFTGKVIATQTGSPLLEVLAGMIPGNEAYKPAPDVIPAYVNHPFYYRRVGNRQDSVYKNTFMVPVGIKYIEEQRRTDATYKNQDPMPGNWRDAMLIGGEESSGLTTRGHVTDKDGAWANLLVMDMLAYFGTRPEKPLNSLMEIWEDTCRLPGCWLSYGTRYFEGSQAGRSDVDAYLEVKEALINYYLDSFGAGKDNSLAGLEVIYAGGVRYDLVEMRLRDAAGDDRHFLRMRASGTEPINRIYIESSSPVTARQMMQTVLARLASLNSEMILAVESEWRLAEILTTTVYTTELLQVVQGALSKRGWSSDSLAQKLRSAVELEGYLENRNRRMARQWIDALV